MNLASLITPMLLPSWLNPVNILTALGNWALWGVVLIVMVECGLFCFFLPGDSLLFAVGMFIATPGAVAGQNLIHFGHLHSGVVLVICCAILSVAAVAGNFIGYWLGRVIGPPLLKPREGLIGKILKQEYADKTHDFLEKRGHFAIVLARFVPIVRTFVTLVAGISRMNFGTYISFTAIGGVIWGSGVTILGYFLGSVSFIHNHIELVLVLIVLVSLIPMGVEWWNQRRHAKQAPPVEAPSAPRRAEL